MTPCSEDRLAPRAEPRVTGDGGRHAPRPPVRTVGVKVMCFNEEPTIVDVVRRTLAAAGGHTVSVEVIDDGSTDGSGMRVLEAFVGSTAVEVHTHPSRRGVGAVLRHAFRPTNFDAVVLLCGDLQFHPEDIFALLSALDDADLAIALRPGRQDAGARKLLTAADRALTTVLVGSAYPEVHWVRAVRRDWLHGCNFVSRSPIIDLELAHRIDRNGGRIVTLPLPHYPRRYGKSHGATLATLGASLVDLLHYAARYRLSQVLGRGERHL